MICAELTLLFGILLTVLLHAFDINSKLVNKVVLLFVLCMIGASWIKVLCILLTLWVMVVFSDTAEYFEVLLLFSLLGALVMIDQDNGLKLYIGIELMALPLYALSISHQYQPSKEAALKYFVMGAIGSVLILYGLSYLYLATGSLSLVQGSGLYIDLGAILVFAGILIKLGLVPFHMWVPDIYQTAPLGVVAWIALVPKITFLLLLFKLLSLSNLLVELLPVMMSISMVYGSIMALLQVNIRRLLAYSSIAHLGLALLPLSYGQLDISLFYLLAYIVMTMAFFISLKSFESRGGMQLTDLAGALYTQRYESLLLLITLASMVGIPPLVGFVAKLNVLSVLVYNEGYMSIVAVIFMSIVSGYYSLNIIRLISAFKDKHKVVSNQWVLVYTLPLLIVGIAPSSLLMYLKIIV